jgi:hypothetical protein
VLLRLPYRFAPYAVYLWDAFEALFGAEHRLWISLCASASYFISQVLVQQLAQRALFLASLLNYAPHLLFPLHVFDFACYYATLGLRSYAQLRWSWVPVTLLLQVNVVLKNSGTMHAVVVGMYRLIFEGQWRAGQGKHSEDPLLKLQFLARLAIQCDLADITAILTVPTVVSYFVWRDEWFSLQGTGILLLPCDLPTVWLHFGLLLVIKPFSFMIARRILERNMYVALLGRSTIHGTSTIAQELVQQRRAAATKTCQRQRSGLGSDRLARARIRRVASVFRGVPTAIKDKNRADGYWRSRPKPVSTAAAASASASASASPPPSPPAVGHTAVAGGKATMALRPQAAQKPRGAPVQCGGAEAAGMGHLSVPSQRGSSDVAATWDIPGAASWEHREVKSTDGAIDPKTLTDFVVGKMEDHLGDRFDVHRRKLLLEEFDVGNLDYAQLFYKTIRRSYFFFACATLFELFAVLPRHVRVPLPGALEQLVMVGEPSINGTTSTRTHWVELPPWAVWARLPTSVTLAIDNDARWAWDRMSAGNATYADNCASYTVRGVALTHWF